MRAASSSKLPIYSRPSSSNSDSSLLGHEAQSRPSTASVMDRRPLQYLLHQLVGQTPRRRLIPLLALSFLSLLLIASFGSKRATLVSSSSSYPSPSSSQIGWIHNIFRRPSKSIPHPKTSFITTDDTRTRIWKSPTPPLPLDATLYERLQDLWDAPLDEPANWVKFNLQTCGRERVKQAQNDWLTQDSSYTWHSMNTSDTREKRKSMIDYLVEAEKKGLLDPDKAGTGRGCVRRSQNISNCLEVRLRRFHYCSFFH